MDGIVMKCDNFSCLTMINPDAACMLVTSDDRELYFCKECEKEILRRVNE
jgi:ribosomal protein L24E